MQRKTRIKIGEKVNIKSMSELLKDYYLNEHDEIVFENVDVHVDMVKMIEGKEIDIDFIDEDKDFKVQGISWTYGNEMIVRKSR